MYFPQDSIASFVHLILPATWGGTVRLLLYVVSSLGLYTLASSRKIKGAWLAWVPLADMWVLGALSDQYQYVVKNRIRSRRVRLPILTMLFYALGTAAAWMLFSILWQGTLAILTGSFVLRTNGTVLAVLLVCLTPLLLWGWILKLMVLYDIYRSCDPHWAVLYLILSIVVPSATSVLLFLNRDKEAGMPPRITEE